MHIFLDSYIVRKLSWNLGQGLLIYLFINVKKLLGAGMAQSV